MNIILFSPDELSGTGLVVLTDERHRHIRDVLRAKEGDFLTCGVTGISKGQGTVRRTDRQKTEIDYRAVSPPGPPLDITLLVGMVRPIQARRILKAAAAYGIRQLRWTPTALGEKSYEKAGLWHHGAFRQFLLEGASQGGHAHIPEVHIDSSLSRAAAAVGLPSDSAAGLVLHPGENSAGFRSVYETYARGNVPVSFCAAVGSERGWTEKELSLLTASGFTACRLGPSILRTEDAVHAVLSLLSLVSGQMD